MTCSNNCMCVVLSFGRPPYADDVYSQQSELLPLLSRGRPPKRTSLSSAASRLPATANSHENSPVIRRSRSLELRGLFSTRRRSVPDSRPQAMAQVHHGADLAEFTNTIKNRVKAALKKAPRPPSSGSEIGSEQSTPVKRPMRTKDRIAQSRKELELALRYFQEVIRTDKVEMLGGSVSVILDCVINCLSTLHQCGLQTQSASNNQNLYSAVVSLVEWSDRQVLERAVGGPETSLNRQSVLELSEQLLTALDLVMTGAKKAHNRQSTDSGTLTSLDDDNNNAPPKAPPPLPPRANLNRAKRKNSPPTSGDSGIFNETDSLPMIDENLNSDGDLPVVPLKHEGAKMFRQSSLEDFLAKLNVSDALSEDLLPSESSTLNDSGLSQEVTRDEIEQIVDGKRVKTVRTRRHISVTKSTSHQSITLSASDGADDLLKELRNSETGQVTLVESQQVKLGSASHVLLSESSSSAPPPLPPRLRKQRVPSFYENNHPTPPGSAPVSPEHRINGYSEQKVLHHNATTRSIGKKTTLNGKVLRDDATHATNESLLSASKSCSFVDGRPVDERGEGTFEEHSVIHRGPPPVPPRRQNVVHYMKLLDVHDSPKSPSADPQKQQEFRKSTLASYVVLRDNLCQFEEIYRKKVFSIPHKFPSVTDLAPILQTPKHEYCNLESVLSFNDQDRLRLPIRFEEPETPKTLPHYQRRLALPAPSVLDCLDVGDYLVLRSNATELEEVRGGPIDALIVYAAQPGTALLLYQEAFLVSYRTFVSAAALIGKLVARYANCTRSNDTAHKKAARNTFSLLVRIVDELSCVELTSELVDAVNAFVYKLIKDGELNLSRLLRQRLLDRVEEKAGFRKTLPRPTSPTVALPARLSSLLEFKSSLIAEQLTCNDSELFQKIELSEMLSWAQEQSEEKSPNLVEFTEHFNKMSYWVRTRVLKQPEHKDRERVLLKFVKIMKHLRRLGNFNSFLALLSAVDSGPVRRLEWSKSVSDVLQEHTVIMDSSKSFSNYRTSLSQSRPPCLPYIGLILQDLTFIHVGNPDYLPAAKCQGRKDLVNFGKRWQQFAILDSVRKFKGWQYDFERDDRIQSMFNNFEDFLSEDAIWELSESIKPRPPSRRPPIIMDQ